MPSSESGTETGHVDPEQLALLALDEPLTTDEARHLEGCAVCRQEAAELRAVVTTVRQGDDGAPPVTPPASVWDRVAAATGVSVDRTVAVGPDADQVGDPATGSAGEPAAQSVAGAPLIPPAAPVDLAARRERRRQVSWGVAAAGVAAGALVGAALAVGLGAAGTGGDDLAGDEPVIERASLQVLAEGEVPAGDAEAVVVQVDGHRQLRLSVPELEPREDGFYEVWLLDEDASGMVPIGVLAGDTTSLPLPPGLSMAEFPVVDVSLEPFDGDPTHSGNSLLRGALRT